MSFLEDAEGGWLSLVCDGEYDSPSSCLQRTGIDGLNVAFLLVLLLLSLVNIIKGDSASRHNTRTTFFFVVSLFCVLASFAHFGFGLWLLLDGNGGHKHWNLIVYPVRGLIWIAVAISCNFQSTKFTRALILIWWVSFSLLVSMFNVKTLVHTHSLQILDGASWLVNLLLLISAGKILASLFSHQAPNKSLHEPLLKGTVEGITNRFSPISLFTFSWIDPLLRLGYSRPLVLDDVPELGDEDGAETAYQSFIREWEKQRDTKPNSRNLTLGALTTSYWKDMLVIGAYAFIRSAAVSASPLLLNAVVQYSGLYDRSLVAGISLVGCLTLVKVSESLSQRYWFFHARRVGMRMRSAVMAAVFQKQLRLSSLARRNHSAGEIVNYVAVDAYRLGEFPWWFHTGWTSPLQLLFAIAILFAYARWATIPGLVPVAFAIFLNFPYAKLMQNCQTCFMDAQDERLRAMSEILNSIKIIKLQVWEEKFKNLIGTLRASEFKWLSSVQFNKTYNTVLYWMSPTFVSAAIIAGCAMFAGTPLNAATIFTILSTMRVMAEPVRMLPEAICILIQVKVSLDRLDRFLIDDELELIARDDGQISDSSVEINEGTFSWEPDAHTPTLRGISLAVRRGEKIAVCGAVGAGKSSLLQAILGEMPRLSGSVKLYGSVAYVAQIAWIQSGTVRDNVLFGKEMDKSKYEKAIKSCALDKDIENFAHGDLTEIGERGLNLSGGQKQRIQLARAVYNDADVYLLDDPFSAVDAHTAATLFNDCVMTALKKKTVILVTHQVEFLSDIDRVLVMEGGKVTQCGSYYELLKAGMAFEMLVTAHKEAMTVLNPTTCRWSKEVEKPNLCDSQIGRLQVTQENCEGDIPDKEVPKMQLTQDEEKEIGDLGLKPYLDYLRVSRGHLSFLLVILSQGTFVVLQILSTYWLATAVTVPSISHGVLVGVFSGISVCSGVFAYLRSLFTTILGLEASKAFFSGFVDSIFRAPMSFFDSTPVGRIFTRASSDMSMMDFDIPYALTFALAAWIEVIAFSILMSIVTWQLLIVVIPAILITLRLQNYYLASSRELIRINGTTKAPVMNYAAETTFGAVTIRAFFEMERFIKKNLQLIDRDAKLFFYTNGAMEWVLLRVEALQNAIVFAATLLLVVLPSGTVTAELAGLSLSYALAITGTQSFATRWCSNLANYIISVERIKQFMNLPTEAPYIVDDNRPPSTWPENGKIELQDLKIRYRPNAPLVLKGITCSLEAGHRIGVVGRTGSGKTTLISALLRLVEPVGGRILIDGLDICSMGLWDLRSKLSIIPQEPTLFRGTVRSNLDPLGLYSDLEIWEALRKCQLFTTIRSLPHQLDTSVRDEGENWSAGQRQLFCLGRVLLKRNKILVLDEATASIDSATDAILQRVIRQEFSDCTVITVAHRVPTVTDSDMVMVLSFGELLEYDKPEKLMETNSSFAKLVAEYWSNCSRENSSNNLSEPQ
ncbi:ABC transporter C family member 8 [Nymphaea colorata]|nr:ABC transporter C family member 8 [Nymphaea colorata]